MFKKILVILVIGLFLFTACSQKEDEPIEPTAEPTEAENIPDPVTEEPTEEEVEVIPGETANMPCATVLDYPTSEEADFYQAIVDQLEPVTDEDRIYGNPDAPITIMEYADFQCPACPSFSLAVKGLVDEYPDSIRFVFRHLPLYSIHDKAYISSMAAEAAGAQDPAKFWEMHDILYINQQQWSPLSEDAFVDWVKTQAESIGLDVDQFETDLYDKEVREEMEVVTDERLSLGVNYTPFKVVNERIYQDNQPDIFGLLGIYEYDGFEECPPWVIEPETSYIARLDTSAGIIDIELFADVAPLAVNSFIFLAQQGWYDSIYFHRVVEGFVAQAGDPSGQGYVGPGYTFANETNNDLSYDTVGMVGMANAGPDSNGSQFFITLAPATELDGGYTIFGKVTEETLPILDEIALRDPSTATSFDGATVINSIEIIEP
jgi:cyclophilin family peptidyl-prolyl cis-trans isomerase/protein-disulfide isomerase